MRACLAWASRALIINAELLQVFSSVKLPRYTCLLTTPIAQRETFAAQALSRRVALPSA